MFLQSEIGRVTRFDAMPVTIGATDDWVKLPASVLLILTIQLPNIHEVLKALLQRLF